MIKEKQIEECNTYHIKQWEIYRRFKVNLFNNLVCNIFGTRYKCNKCGRIIYIPPRM